MTNTTSGNATLSFTAPGDDGNNGQATSYDLRYSTSQITDQTWSDAGPAGGLPASLAAGSNQTIRLSGLEAGTTYYFALRARDESALFSPVSNVATGNTTILNLAWARQRVCWVSYSDYQNRQLSIDYRMTNSGTGLAVAPTVHASICSPPSVYVTTPLPLAWPLFL